LGGTIPAVLSGTEKLNGMKRINLAKLHGDFIGFLKCVVRIPDDTRTPNVRKKYRQRAHAFISFQGNREVLTENSRFDNLESEHIPPVSSETGREAVPFGAASAFSPPAKC
jgi:hypothetical protein